MRMAVNYCVTLHHFRFHDEVCARDWFEATHGFQEPQWLGNEVSFSACKVSFRGSEFCNTY